MGFLDSVRLAASLPTLLATRTPVPQAASPFASTPNHLNQVVWPDLLGADWLPMTRVEAMAVPAIARARRLLAGTAARIPLRAYAGESDTPLPVQPRWLDSTAGVLSPFHRMLWTIDDLMFYGWSLWSVARDADGQLTAADRVLWERWEFDAEGRVLVDEKLAANESVILIPGLDEGLLTFAARTIRHASHLITAADRAAETPSAQLELHQTNDVPMTDEAIGKLVTQWAEARRGKNGGVAYTNAAIEVKEHGAAAEHLLIEGRNASAVDVARATGIPASLLDATGIASTLTYETTAGRNAEFIDYGLAPFLAAVSARLGMDDVVPSGVRLAFDPTDFVGTTLEVGTPDDGGPRSPAPTGGPASLPVGAGSTRQENDR
ncbi:phage portal protein [Rhodococcus tibetensis]|uniref:Phage portal protein n=1 Tax=Rhodococcus tibetensis TaxID=2965064 RepID=A0ABT1QDQ1_9NOCA|nr:phage portal protein [Rhodococcus sp. FXJ9.536]MCQ4120413.1 phage portal protein [Rhodococcus sp. FXJ9.536]